jgi:hypothetical protein
VEVLIFLMHPCHSESILAPIILVRSMVGIPAGPSWYSLELFQPTSEGVLCWIGTVKNVLTTVVCSFHICSLKVGIVSAAGREATISSSFYSICDLALGRKTEKKTCHGSKYQLLCSFHISLFGNTGVKTLGWQTTHFWCFSWWFSWWPDILKEYQSGKFLTISIEVDNQNLYKLLNIGL